MVSHLRNLIEEIAQKKEMKIESYHEDELALIEKHLDNGQIDIDEALEEVKKIFSFHFSDGDYRGIGKQLGFRK